MKSMTRTQLGLLLDMPPDQRVRVYTYQNRAAVDQALASGRLIGTTRYAAYDEPYAWMRDQMAKMVIGHSGSLPIWAWVRRPDCRRKMRDPGPGMVRVTAMVPRGRMVISDINMWSAVLNDAPVLMSDAESDAHDARWDTTPEPGHADRDAYDAMIRPTWRRVFDPLAAADHEWWGDRRRANVQACVDGVHVDEIVSMREFTR